jgi:hypothetical protein
MQADFWRFKMHWTQFIPPLISPAIKLAEKAVEWYGNSKKASSLA